ncbi:MAG TPA: prepilin-type N-terminal cleavage/methylation domain-containing protein [Opitutaceae bacterium]|nr:prepilin-type N-terminal cleavage/methylation domain-containing protein [Opitutaceae bacterium]
MKTNPRRGVTLVELMIAMAISGLVLAGVMSTYLFIARSSIRVSNYTDMEREATLSLEKLGREVRMAEKLVSTGTPVNAVTLTIPNSSGTGTHAVTYTYDSGARTLSRTSGTETTVIIRNIQTGSFSFKRFDKLQNSLDLPGVTLPDYSTKQLQVTLTIAPDTKGLVASTTKRVISSRFVLRNL